MISSLFSNPILFLLEIISIIVALTIHEFSHAFVADYLGDPTPRLQGRLSLNPLRHLDPLGTILLIVARFGWGKPVEFDPYNLKRPQRDTALIALAGPASNILLAILLSVILHFTTIGSPNIIQLVLAFMLSMNVTLAIFNLLPVYPLDGGKILLGILPHETAVELDGFLHRYGFIILLFLIFPFGNSQSPVSYLINPVITAILNVLLPF